MSQQPILKTEIHIPAYTASQEALLITLSLKAVPHTHLSIKTTGNLAVALKRPLQRTIEIMHAIHPAWQTLHALKYVLKGNQPEFIIKDARSAGLPFAIALISIDQQLHGKTNIPSNLIGTGILRTDGSIESTHREDLKKTVLKNNTTQFINSNCCSHLFELNHFMEEIR